MKFEKLRQALEQMPVPAYIFLRAVLKITVLMLALSLGFFLFGQGAEARGYAVVFLELPASILLLGAVGLALLWDTFQE